jgi:hypothetical protein
MRIDDQQILAISRLGHDILWRGDGLSLHAIFTVSGHVDLIDKISRSRLVRLLKTQPKVHQQWIKYGENKPTNRGHWISSKALEVGNFESPDCCVRYGSLQEAVAEFIIRELAYWLSAGEINSASPDLPTVDELVAGLDQKRQADVDHAQNRLFNPYEFETLIPGLIGAYGRIRSWRGRNAILFNLIRFARKRPEVLKLALLGLQDSAFLVRMQSCVMLAYSQREDLIPYLQRILTHKDKKTREYAESAIDHIRAKTVFYHIQQP